MVLFNYSTKELTAKVVYYGPGLCGKTTNLQWIHEKLPIKNKGKMLSLATETDRTLFFDFLPIELGTIRGMKTRIQLYTVPGQVFYNATRRMVLKGADCVVFVCDSQEAMLEANRESFKNLRENLEANEIDPNEIPMVLQYNKRDLPNALPIEILNEGLNANNNPFFEAVAVKGIGVEETLKGVTSLVFRSLATKYGGSDAQAAARAPIVAPAGAAPPVTFDPPIPPPRPTPPPALAPAAAPAPAPAARLPIPGSQTLPPTNTEPKVTAVVEEVSELELESASDLLFDLEPEPFAPPAPPVAAPAPVPRPAPPVRPAPPPPTPPMRQAPDPRATLIRGESDTAELRAKLRKEDAPVEMQLEEEILFDDEPLPVIVAPPPVPPPPGS